MVYERKGRHVDVYAFEVLLKSFTRLLPTFRATLFDGRHECCIDSRVLKRNLMAFLAASMDRWNTNREALLEKDPKDESPNFRKWWPEALKQVSSDTPIPHDKKLGQICLIHGGFFGRRMVNVLCIKYCKTFAFYTRKGLTGPLRIPR